MAGQNLVVERVVNGQRDRLGEWRLPLADDVRLETREVEVVGGSETEYVVTWYGPQAENVVEEEVSPGVIVKREFTEEDAEKFEEAGGELDDDGLPVVADPVHPSTGVGAGPGDEGSGKVSAAEVVAAGEAAEAEDEDEEFLTGDALTARAQELDIEGRSSMTADELRAAIAEAEAE